MNTIPNFSKQLWYSIIVYLLAIVCFTLFRLLVLMYNIEAIESISEPKYFLLAKAFWFGFRFDTLIVCAVLALPLLVGGLAYLFGLLSKTLLQFLYYYLAITFGIAFFISAVDIPFFRFFFKRLNDTIFNWNNAGGFGLKMILQEKRYYAFFIVYVIILCLFLFLLKRIYRLHKSIITSPKTPWYKALPVLLIVWALVFVGIRGRLSEKSPMIAGAAFFSKYPFINQLGLNPVFTLLRSTLDRAKTENKELHWVEDNEMLATMKAYFSKDSLISNSENPIARWQKTKPILEGHNIVLVIMESLAAHRMKRFGNTQNLTPFLDSLATVGISFDSTFSAGIHTYNGIYSTLFAHPALMKRHTMDQLTIPRIEGMASTLSASGYQSIFFTTHDELFDNMSGFLLANDFETIFGQKDYPAAEVVSTLGVPDEYMFRFAIPKLNKLYQNKKPFFAAFMTGTNHNPHVLPKNVTFKQRSEDMGFAVIEFTDWSIQKMMSYASQQSWYSNTVFVFVADHGVPLWADPYDIPFTYHHIPFIIYSPKISEAQNYSKLALQTDVYPTIMGLVAPSYQNNSFGIDLLSQTHKQIVFSSDDALACMNDSLLFVYRSNGTKSLYKYRNNDKTDYSQQFHSQKDSLSKIAFSWLQCSQKILIQKAK